ncbi:MAG: RluA family pseudouridine synthase [Bacillus sp. (in: firmicutes)]
MEYTRKGNYLEIIYTENIEDMTVDDLLRSHWQAPKKLLHTWRMDKTITLNGKQAVWNERLKAKDRLMLPLYMDTADLPPPSELDIDVLYEDCHLLIVNKPAGMETHPSKPGQTDTLVNGVLWHLMLSGETGGAISHIHRLDKDTTGAVLFAKHALAANLLNKMLEARDIKRTYHALVQGRVKQKTGIIDAKIGRDRHHATKRRVSLSGQEAVTHFKVIQYFHDQNLTWLECHLDTGRTHQIRVHLSHIGHPLAGDTLYGGKNVFDRQALHARKIRFTHPFTDEIVDVTAPYLDHPPIFRK